MEYFQRNFKGSVNLCFGDVICRLEQRNGAPRSYGKVSFAPQNAGIFASTLGQSFRGSPRCARAAERERERGGVCMVRKARRANEQAAVSGHRRRRCRRPACGVSAVVARSPKPHAYLAVVAHYCFDGEDITDLNGALALGSELRDEDDRQVER
jgi:hypothetical protein